MIIDWNHGWQLSTMAGKAETVNLPHDAMIHEERYAANNNGSRTGYFPGGKYFYKKVLDISAEMLESDIILHCDGIYRHATIHVNGDPVYFHAYGYTPFDVDLTKKLHEGENPVKIEVDNSFTPNSRWYSGSGMNRGISLEIRPKDHIGDVHIETIALDPPQIKVTASGRNITVVIEDSSGNHVCSGSPGVITIPGAKLWDADHPNLYTAVISNDADLVKKKFGIRLLRWNSDQGLLINGKSVKLRGCCIHSDNGILGACSYPDAEERKIRILKESGYNAIRSAHNPASEALLDACDKLGMYVMDELYDGWYKPKTYHDNSRDFENCWREDVRNWVMRDKNHPSVIMYSIGNEVTEPATEQGIQIGGMLADAIREIDNSRPVTCGMNIMLMKWNATFTDQGEYEKKHLPDEQVKDEKGGSAFFNAMMLKLGSALGVLVKGKKSAKLMSGLADKLDIVGLNYGEHRYDEEASAKEKRLIVGSETLVSRQWYNWPRVEKYPNLIGDFVWTGFDYLGETDIGQWYYEGQKGLPILYGGATIDITGRPDAQLAYQQVIWGVRKEPYLGVRPLTISDKKYIRRKWRLTDIVDSWTWHGSERKQTTVEVFTLAPKVGIYLNGKLIAKRKTKHGISDCPIIYQPGVLEAVAYDFNGKETGRTCLQTHGQLSAIRVQPEKRMLRANGQDLCYLAIDLIDEDNHVILYDDRTLTITVDGAGTLAGFGSARPITDERYDGNTHTTYFGHAQAVIRASLEPGAVRIHLAADGLPPTEITIHVED